MDQTKIHWHVDSLMVLIQVARLFPASSNFATVEKKYKDDIFTTPAGSGVAVLGLTLIVNLTNTLLRNPMLKNLLLRKQF